MGLPHARLAAAIPLSLCLVALLKCKMMRFLATFALRCSSFTPVNRGTSARCPCASLGYQNYPSVSESNKLTCRNSAFGFRYNIFGFSFGKLYRLFCLGGFGYMNKPLKLRTILLCLVTTALGGCYFVEQPGGSCLRFFPPFRQLLMNLYQAEGGTAVPTRV